jgi:hypothetical protein
METVMSKDRAPTATALAGLAAIALLITAGAAEASGPIVPPRPDHGHKPPPGPKPPHHTPPGDHNPPRDGKPHQHGRHHKWHRHLLETSLRESGWVCVKAYRDRRGFWRCTAWAMQ